MDDNKKKAPEGLAEPEKVHTLDPKIAREHTTFYDKKNGMWRQSMAEDPVGRRNRNPWVYEFSRDNLPPYESSRALTPEGALMQRKNIGEVGYDETVHGFVKDIVNPIQVKAPRAEPWAANGSGPHGWGSNAFIQKKNIGEVGYDETVHGFVKDIVNPIQAKAPRSDPWAANGSGPNGWGSDVGPNLYMQRRNIGEVGYDETVHGFVKDIVNPIQAKAPRDSAWGLNGSGPNGWGSDTGSLNNYIQK